MALRSPPKPLPLIEPDDVHLGCRMAIVPSEALGWTPVTIVEQLGDFPVGDKL